MTTAVLTRPRHQANRPPDAARHVLAVLYALLGLTMAAWGARLPAVQRAADLDAGLLSVVLLAAAVGMVTALGIGGHLIQRYGPSRLLVAPAAVFGLTLAALGWCTTLPTLVLVALAWGAAHGLLDVAVNSAAVNVQNQWGRPIMSGLHACYSLGALAGALLIAVTTGLLGLSHTTQLGVVGVFMAACAVLLNTRVRALSPYLDRTAGSANSSATLAHGSQAVVWVLGGLAAACLFAEGAAADWSAVHLHGLGAGDAVAAAAYALYSAAMAVGRLCGDRFIGRYGGVAVVKAGALVAAVGLGAGVALDGVWSALVGWMLLGAGLAVTVPCLVTAAGRCGPRAVGTVTALGYVSFLVGPAAVGAVATMTSLAVALFIPVALVAVVAAAATHTLER